MKKHRPPRNDEVARALREIALYLEAEGIAFKPRAYEKAAYAVASLDRPLHEIDAEAGLRGIEEIPSIGKGIAKKIHQFLTSRRIDELEHLRTALPVDLVQLTGVEGLGPKMAKALYDSLDVKNLAELECACREGAVQKLPHFGVKSEQKLLRGIELLKQNAGRHPLGDVLPLAREIEARLREVKGVRCVEIAGSIRRRKETIGDLDFLVVADDPARVSEFFAELPEVVNVHAHGESKTSVRLAAGLDADLRTVPEESFGAALTYFTGSKDHNVALRRITQEKKLKLNEYGVFRGEKKLAGRTEADVYAALGLAYVPPELREDRGEIDAAREQKLPHLIEYGSLRGDLQIQTDWTDGAASIEDMAAAAKRLGLEYIAITDHTRDLSVAHGNDEERLLAQIAAIRKLNQGLAGFRILAGAEVNIRKDGTLDIADEVLAQLDVVGVAVHSLFQQPREEMTRRVLRAIENPHVDILFHPTARDIGKREPVDLDIDALIEAAHRTGTVLEIDAMPKRLDLKDEHVRKAVAAGVKLVIDSDAHHPHHLAYADEFGVAVARRGWARAADVINTLPVGEFLRQLKDGRRGAAKDSGSGRKTPQGKTSTGKTAKGKRRG